MNEFNLTIITPQGKILDEKIQSIIAPGTEGSFGVLSGHTPLVSTLKKGVLEVSQNNTKESFRIGEGTLEVNTENKVLVLVDFAEKA